MSIGMLILKYAVCYCAFLVMLLLSKANGGYKLFDQRGPAQNSGALLGLQISGIIWLGIVPIFISGQSWLQIVFGENIPGLFPVFTIIILLAATVLFARIQSENLFRTIVSGQKPIKVFSWDFALRYVSLRFLFLCAYEIFLRGYLLTVSIHYLGIIKAIVLNVALYTLLHISAGKKEMIACIPFGVLLCVICIWLNAVWPAIALHVTLFLTYEINLVRKFSKPLKAIL